MVSFLLSREGCAFDNIDIISNQVVWNDKGVATKYIEPIIHSVNKTDFLKDDLLTKNVLLVGDNIHDADMVKDTEGRLVYRVGIYENQNLNNLEKYKENFDVVFVNDSTAFFEILKSIGGR